MEILFCLQDLLFLLFGRRGFDDMIQMVMVEITVKHDDELQQQMVMVVINVKCGDELLLILRR